MVLFRFFFIRGAIYQIVSGADSVQPKMHFFKRISPKLGDISKTESAAERSTLENGEH
jgi:hypothetical protein